MTELKKFSAAMELLRRRVNREVPMQQITLLLAVAEQPGITMPELMKVLEMPQGSVSRNIKALSCYVDQKDGVTVPKGYDLLRTAPDKTNRRSLAVYLTAHGELLVRDLARILSYGRNNDAAFERTGRRDYVRSGLREMFASEGAAGGTRNNTQAAALG